MDQIASLFIYLSIICSSTWTHMLWYIVTNRISVKEHNFFVSAEPPGVGRPLVTCVSPWGEVTKSAPTDMSEYRLQIKRFNFHQATFKNLDFIISSLMVFK